VKATLGFVTIGLLSIFSLAVTSGPAQAADNGGKSVSTARAAASGMPNGCTSPLGDSPFKDGPFGPVSFRSACNPTWLKLVRRCAGAVDGVERVAEVVG
jgi:hypothetical protein